MGMVLSWCDATEDVGATDDDDDSVFEDFVDSMFSSDDTGFDAIGIVMVMVPPSLSPSLVPFLIILLSCAIESDVKEFWLRCITEWIGWKLSCLLLLLLLLLQLIPFAYFRRLAPVASSKVTQ